MADMYFGMYAPSFLFSGTIDFFATHRMYVWACGWVYEDTEWNAILYKCPGLIPKSYPYIDAKF